MIRKTAFLFFVAALLLPAIACALSEEDFYVKTTDDLVTLCSPAPDDPLASEAIHFCEGYCVGAFHYYRAANSGPEGARWICFEEPAPSRDTVINMFVEWAKKKPQYMNDKPVESLFRFLIETFPCKE